VSRRPVVFIAGGGTGGHLMPALALAAALRKAQPEAEPFLVGATRGVEAQVLPTRDFRYALLPMEPIYRRTWWRNVRWPLVLGQLTRQLGQLFREEQPVAVLGTGGYASGPVVWWAARRKLPTAIQEQNAFPGLATRLLAHRVRHIYLGVPEARRLLKPGSGTRLFDTGNPITPPDTARRAGAMARLGLDPSRPVLLITGGSQGSLAINRAVARWLEQRSEAEKLWQVLWLAGRATYQEFSALGSIAGVIVRDFQDPMADAYAVADLVISRAGMMTVAELCAWGLPAILVPLPTAASDHQTQNARVLETAGAACMLLQSTMERDGLGPALQPLLLDAAHRGRLAWVARERGRPDAARDIVSLFLTLLAS
jgi:UDP-N-acetylglucosamine--N-acetylmuramyl-(pentapeptide) pyrophosphoryl-undecaprenol N-acetylglucosamine transferase